MIVRRQLRAIVEGILFAVVMTLYSLMFIYAVRKYIGGNKMSHKSLNNTEEKKPIKEHGGWPNSPFGIFGNEQSADADLKNKFDIVDEENH